MGIISLDLNCIWLSVQLFWRHRLNWCGSLAPFFLNSIGWFECAQLLGCTGLILLVAAAVGTNQAPAVCTFQEASCACQWCLILSSDPSCTTRSSPPPLSRTRRALELACDDCGGALLLAHWAQHDRTWQSAAAACFGVEVWTRPPPPPFPKPCWNLKPTGLVVAFVVCWLTCTNNNLLSARVLLVVNGRPDGIVQLATRLSLDLFLISSSQWLIRKDTV